MSYSWQKIEFSFYYIQSLNRYTDKELFLFIGLINETTIVAQRIATEKCPFRCSRSIAI